MTRSLRFLVLLGVAVAGSVAWPVEAEAQRRVFRSARPRTFVYVGVGRYYYPHWHHSPFYSPYYAGWYGYGPYAWQRFPPYYGRWYDDSASARIQVKPRETQVYVDGYFVGTVDDFDGYLQRLHLPPGEHELVLYLEGHRTFRERVLFRPRTTLRINHTMQPLAAGEATDPRPTPTGPPPGRERGPVPSRGRDRDYGPPPDRRGEAAGFGELSLRVQPADAVVTIDGERWDSPEGGSRLQVQLSAGQHRVEVRKEGHRPYSTTVDVRRGETVSLNVSLPRDQ